MGMAEYRRLKERLNIQKKLLKNVQEAMSGHGLVCADNYKASADTIYGLCDIFHVAPEMVQIVDDKEVIIFHYGDEPEDRIPITHKNNIARDIIGYFHNKVVAVNKEISDLIFDERGIRKKEYINEKL
jgi:hypothetical protein